MTITGKRVFAGLAAVATAGAVMFAPVAAGAATTGPTTPAVNEWTKGPATIAMADSPAAYNTWLKPGQLLKSGNYVRSANGYYRLLMQSDGNLVEYVKSGQKWVAKWSTQTHGNNGAYAAMQKDGNFVVYKGKKAVWSTRIQNYKIKGLALQNDSNLVSYSTTNKPLWHRWITISTPNTSAKIYKGYSVVSANRVFKLIMQSDGNLVLYKGTKALWGSKSRVKDSYAVMQADGNLVVYRKTTATWHSKTGGNPGAFLSVQNDGNVVIYKGRTPIWSTGTHG